jgi:hypothetical protein
MELAFLITYSIVLIVVLVISHLERKDLYDRLMSKTLVEYKDNIKEEANKIAEPKDDTIPLEDAHDELFGDE